MQEVASYKIPSNLIVYLNPVVFRDKNGTKCVREYKVLDIVRHCTYGEVRRCEEISTGKIYVRKDVHDMTVVFHKLLMTQQFLRFELSSAETPVNIDLLITEAMKKFYTASLLRKKEFSNRSSNECENKICVTTGLDKVFREIGILQSVKDIWQCVHLHEALITHNINGRIYLVLEYAEGGHVMEPSESVLAYKPHISQIRCNSDSQPLFSYNKADEGFLECIPERVVQCFAKDLLSCLHQLHSPEYRIMHGDIKPDNVLMTKSGHVVLGDFGCASYMKENFEAVSIEGTYAFWPPEYCELTYSPRDGRLVDAWALGLTLWAMLFSQLPFNNGCLEDLFDSISNFDVLSHLQSQSIKLSDSGKDVLLFLLEKDPQKRYLPTDLLKHPWILETDYSYAKSYVSCCLQS